MVRVLSNPNMIKTVIAGGTHRAIGIFTGGLRRAIVKKIELPAHWEKLVKKYNGVAHTYKPY